MSDNSQQSISENEVKQQEIKQDSAVFEPKKESAKTTENVESDKKMVPLHELYKERNRRRGLEDEVTRLRQEHDQLKQVVSKVQVTQGVDSLVDQAEKELGIDKEAAKKLLNLQRKVAEAVTPSQTVQETTQHDPVLNAMNEFKRRAAEASYEFEDWNDHIPAMQAIMAKEIEVNGLNAYSKSPEFYYSRALKASKINQERARKEDTVDRNNITSVSMVESGSGPASSGSSAKINQSVFDANRGNPQWVRENSDEIKRLWREGKLK